MSKKRKFPKNAQIALHRLRVDGGSLCRQASTTEDAMKNGAGFIYFTMKGRPVGPKTARFLIEKEAVQPVSDGLFDGQSQTFAAISADEFEILKARYEAM